MMNRNENSVQITNNTSSQQRSDFNVIESLKEYNRSQKNKILSIENDTALDHDVGGTTHDINVPQLTEPAGIVKTVMFSVQMNVYVCLFFFYLKKFFIYICS